MSDIDPTDPDCPAVIHVINTTPDGGLESDAVPPAAVPKLAAALPQALADGDPPVRWAA